MPEWREMMRAMNNSRKNEIRKFAAGMLCAAVMSLSLTACSDENNTVPDAGQAEMSVSVEQSQGTQSASSESIYLYGRINEVIGNELTIQLSDTPKEEEAPSEEGKSDSQSPADGMAAVAVTPAQIITIGEAAGGSMDMEFTGESITIKVPAGLKIQDSQGQEVGAASLTKGKVLGLYVDNMEDLNLQSITIME